MNIVVRKLHPLIGAEIRGVDLHRPMDADVFAAVHDAWMQHLVVVFPDQNITDEEHVAFTRHFGEPEIFHQAIIRSKRMQEIFRVSNVNDDNVLMPPDHPTVKQVGLAQMWHTDSSYRALPCLGSLLHGVEISRTGGATRFINMYEVYDALPDRLKQRIEGRYGAFVYGGRRRAVALLNPEDQDKKPALHALARVHPETGRKGLYFDPGKILRVEGVEAEESDALIDELTTYMVQPGATYHHQWQKGDIVIWDNRCSYHKAAGDYPPEEDRIHWRVSIKEAAAAH